MPGGEAWVCIRSAGKCRAQYGRPLIWRMPSSPSLIAFRPHPEPRHTRWGHVRVCRSLLDMAAVALHLKPPLRFQTYSRERCTVH